MGVVKCCSQEDFQALGRKAYRNIPRSLLKIIFRELPDYAAVAYLTLYDLAKVNTRYPGTVVISHKSLGKELGKSAPSIKRAVKKLQEHGFIEIIQQGDGNKNYLPNIFKVLCPDHIAKKILSEEPDRRATILQFPIKKPKSTFNPVGGIIMQPKDVKKPDVINATNHFTNNAVAVDELYLEYRKEMSNLINCGYSPLKASQEAFKIFSAELILVIQQRLLKPSTNTTEDICSSTGPNLRGRGLISDPHKINNNRDQDLLLTIDRNFKDKFVELHQRGSSMPKSVVDFKKVGENVTFLLDKVDKENIERKIRAMHRFEEIHSNICHRYSDSVDRLVQEVIFHCLHRDMEKLKTIKHALNAAAKMLRQGTWATPKRLVQQEIKHREEETVRQKYLEIQRAQAFFKQRTLLELRD